MGRLRNIYKKIKGNPKVDSDMISEVVISGGALSLSPLSEGVIHEGGHALTAIALPSYELNSINMNPYPLDSVTGEIIPFIYTDITGVGTNLEKGILYSAGYIANLISSAVLLFAAGKSENPIIKHTLYSYVMFSSVLNTFGNILRDFSLSNVDFIQPGNESGAYNLIRTDIGELEKLGVPGELSFLLLGIPALAMGAFAGYKLIKSSVRRINSAIKTTKTIAFNETRKEFLMRTNPEFKKMMEGKIEFEETRIAINEVLDNHRAHGSLESIVEEKAL